MGTTGFQKIKGATTIVLVVVIVVTTQGTAIVFVALFVHMQPGQRDGDFNSRFKINSKQCIHFIWDAKQGKNKLEYPTSMYSFDEEEGGINIEGV